MDIEFENIDIEKWNANITNKKKTPVIIVNWENRKNWHFHSTSIQTQTIFGYDIHKLNAQLFDYNKLIHPDDKEIIQKINDELEKADKIIIEPKIYRIITKEGEIRWLKEIITKIDNIPAPHYYQRLILDLTEKVKSIETLRRKNEEYLALGEEYKTINEELLISQKEIKKSEKKYRLLAENISDVIWVFNFTKNKFVYISPSVFQARGYTVKEAMQLSFVDSLAPKSKEKIAKVIPTRLNHFVKQGIKKVYRDELQQRTKNKGFIWVEMLTSLHYAKDGSIEILGVSRITTKRKETELALKKQNEEYLALNEEYKTLNENLQRSEERFKLLSNLTFEGILIHNKGIILDVNISFLNMFGYLPGELINKNVIDIVAAPEYHDVIREKIKTEYILPYEVEGIHKNGTRIPVELESKLIVLNNHNIVRVVAVRDITERRKIKEKIIKLSQAVEQSANTIVITDTNGNIEYVNPKFTELTGYTAKEVLGKNPRILNADPESIEKYKKMWETISIGNIWKGEFKNKTKNNKIFYEKATITPIKDLKGEIINYLGIKEDITEQVKTKRALEDARNTMFYKILEAEEKERTRISADLHDGIGPDLSSLKLHINAIENAKTKKEQKLIIQKSYKILEQTIDNLKRISKSLSPYLLKDFGLNIAISDFTEDLRIGNININYQSNLEKIRFATEFEMSIFRILKELINNSLKYANAKDILIHINYTNHNFNLIYKDNGKGFDVEKVLNSKNSGFGLKNIIHRVKALKGVSDISSGIDKGTKVEIQIHIKNK